MKPVQVRNTIIGEGMPKIIVPLVGISDLELMDEVRAVIALRPDIIEWRVDQYSHVDDMQAVHNILKTLRNEIKDIPLLFTFRSYQEGGKKKITSSYYKELNEFAVQSQLVDLIDLELFTTNNILSYLIGKAKLFGITVIMSNHDFKATPSREEIIARLQRMQEFDADILKIAVMPNSEADVLTLLQATNMMKTKYAERPLITMSMAKMGIFSRLAGELAGSSATFASGVSASAPGQIPIAELRTILENIHQYMR
ncbi:type I 3-dehydroquinate dehydratase [Ornithinibacillus xuwenensis]|uniref:3-dehydroquinate dehydratase n=1 Tax=Ornithinibacillus xuwenensis TaxID=3144668 RepID=A0ABU9XL62_9BACI